MQSSAFAEQQIEACFIVKGHSTVISQGSGTRTAASFFVPEVGETPELEQRSHSAPRDSTSRHIASLPPPGFSSHSFCRTHKQQSTAFMPAKHKPRSKQGLKVEKGSCGTLISRAATMGTAQDSRLPVRTQKLLVAKQQVGDANRRPERHSPAQPSHPSGQVI